MSHKNEKGYALFGEQPLENQAVMIEEPKQTLESQMNGQPVKRGRGRPAKKLVNAIREQRKQGVLIPEKLYFAISEVAEICGVKPYVLRYWESEFKLLRPSKNPSGQRMYQRKDIDMVFKIKKYLYEEGFTIAGAKKKLKEDRKAAQQEGAGSHEVLSKIKGELSNILKSVKK
jgi:DNA-binding transcriptional MerR regulator